MRATKSDVTAVTGLPWSRLRYCSTEEAADDSSVVLIDGELWRVPAAEVARLPLAGLAERRTGYGS